MSLDQIIRAMQADLARRDEAGKPAANIIILDREEALVVIEAIGLLRAKLDRTLAALADRSIECGGLSEL